MKIGIVYNLVDTEERGFDRDIIADNEVEFNVKHVRNALKQIYEVIPIRIHRNNIGKLNLRKLDFIFNLCEGIDGNVEDEALMPALFDLLNIPYTGSDHYTLALCLDKAKTKQLLIAAHIPTPNYQVFYSASDVLFTPIPYPLFVKPLHEDASIGISMESIVNDEMTLRKRVAWVNDHYHQPALVEEYIDGQEINATLLGNGVNLEVLPLTELNFNFSPELPHILDYDAKWIDTSYSYQNITGTCPAQLPLALEKKIRQMAIDATRITGCRDYTRVDFRLRGDQPFILEVNPNPSINPKSGFFRSASASGLTYPQLIQKILAVAQQRYALHVLIPSSSPIPSSISKYFSKHLLFTPITIKDIKHLHTWFNSPTISLYASQSERIYTREELIGLFLLSDSDCISWIISDRQSCAKIGFCSLSILTQCEQYGEISFMMADSISQTPVTSEEIIDMLKTQAIAQCGLHRLMIKVSESNFCSWHALEHLGFVRVGVLHDTHFCDKGKINEFLYEYVHSVGDKLEKKLH